MPTTSRGPLYELTTLARRHVGRVDAQAFARTARHMAPGTVLVRRAVGEWEPTTLDDYVAAAAAGRCVTAVVVP